MLVWCLNPILLKSANLTIAVFSSSRFLTVKNVRILKLRLRECESMCFCLCVCVCACSCECVWQYIGTAAYGGIKTFRTESVQIASSLLPLHWGDWMDLCTLFLGANPLPLTSWPSQPHLRQTETLYCILTCRQAHNLTQTHISLHNRRMEKKVLQPLDWVRSL